MWSSACSILVVLFVLSKSARLSTQCAFADSWAPLLHSLHFVGVCKVKVKHLEELNDIEQEKESTTGNCFSGSIVCRQSPLIIANRLALFVCAMSDAAAAQYVLLKCNKLRREQT